MRPASSDSARAGRCWGAAGSAGTTLGGPVVDPSAAATGVPGQPQGLRASTWITEASPEWNLPSVTLRTRAA